MNVIDFQKLGMMFFRKVVSTFRNHAQEPDTLTSTRKPRRNPGFFFELASLAAARTMP
jgi:hypothetical protein